MSFPPEAGEDTMSDQVDKTQNSTGGQLVNQPLALLILMTVMLITVASLTSPLLKSSI
jgi:hypothetical protein